MPSKQTTAASMQFVITLRDPSTATARMDLLEMASIVLVIINVFFTDLHLLTTCQFLNDDEIDNDKNVLYT